MPLTKDELDALADQHRVPGHATMIDHRAFAAAAIAAHTAKVLEDVEPVAGAVVRGEVVYSATTVAALKSDRDALQARVDAMEKDAGRLDWPLKPLSVVQVTLQDGTSAALRPERAYFSAQAMQDLENSLKRAALAAKGQA